jgi:hypothetical protein
MAEHGQHLVDEIGAGIIEQQDQDQFGYGANHGRVDLEQVTDHGTAIKLAIGAANADEQAKAECAQRDLDRLEEADQKVRAPSGRRQRQKRQRAACEGSGKNIVQVNSSRYGTGSKKRGEAFVDRMRINQRSGLLPN